MKSRLRPHFWLILLPILALVLVACERPLQDEADLTRAPLQPEEDIIPGYPAPEIPESPGLLPTPTISAPVDGEGEGEGVQEPGEAVTEEEPTPSGPIIHTVVAGDTLGNLATQYDVTIEDIAAANSLGNIHSLDIGQQLLIPIGGFVPEEETVDEETGDEETAGEPPDDGGEEQAEERIHTVVAGDNLFRIGQQYGFTIDELVAYNQLTNPDRLEIGQQIRIPPDGYTVDP